MEHHSESHFVAHDESTSRFEIAIGGWTAFAAYRVEGDQMIFTHTEVPPQFRGRGIAKRLVLAGFEAAARNNLKIVPLCSYAAHLLREHPEFSSREKAD
jgi:uncharacterized protein